MPDDNTSLKKHTNIKLEETTPAKFSFFFLSFMIFVRKTYQLTKTYPMSGVKKEIRIIKTMTRPKGNRKGKGRHYSLSKPKWIGP